LFEAVLDEAAGRGEVISTLFPTANGIYRSFCYELIGSYDTVAIASADDVALDALLGGRQVHICDYF
ncbi:MAG: hypothetical protein WKF79_08175, partial [Nocardioides sp.]